MPSESLRRLLWFVTLWAAGVAGLAIVAGALRFAMNAAGF